LLFFRCSLDFFPSGSVTVPHDHHPSHSSVE
jgi:hypothetical protein